MVHQDMRWEVVELTKEEGKSAARPGGRHSTCIPASAGWLRCPH